MIANHDQFTREMCERLETTCIGLGLVRLLQDARRFDEAKTTLYALENNFQNASQKSAKPSQRSSRASRFLRVASRSSGSTRIDAA